MSDICAQILLGRVRVCRRSRILHHHRDVLETVRTASEIFDLVHLDGIWRLFR